MAGWFFEKGTSFVVKVLKNQNRLGSPERYVGRNYSTVHTTGYLD